MDKITDYREILSVLNKHKSILENDYSIDIRDKISNRIKLEEISQRFGINMPSECNPDYCKLTEYAWIGVYGKEFNRTISWSDDGSQPENEMLYCIGFPTGAYIFGGKYPKDTFNNFFNKLKEYGPKYIDSANHCLYFSEENASKVHTDFKTIFDSYKELVDIEMKARKIESLKTELAKLEDYP